MSVHHVSNTGTDGLYLHPGSPTADSAVSDLMPEGTELDILCWQYGDDVNGDAVWDYGTNTTTGHTGFAADYYTDTPVTQGNEPAQLQALGIPQCGTQATSAGATSTTFYDRSAAVAWARANWDHLPLIQNGGDCTWYVSQALWAGGLPTSADWTPYSPNGVLGSDLAAAVKALIHGGYSPTDPINPTINATNANDLINYLVSAGLATKTQIDWSDNTAGGAQLGDLIAYDWEHGSDPSNTIDHVAMVTGYAQGTINPTVSQHSANRLDRYWSWDPASSKWIEFAPAYVSVAGSPNGPPIAYLIHLMY